MSPSLLKMKIKKHDNIFITAHKDLDFDAFGSMLGVYFFIKNIKNYKGECFLIVEDRKHELGVHKLYEQVKENQNIKITSYRKIKNLITANSLLIITDTKKRELVQSVELYDQVQYKLFIDHHIEEEKIQNEYTEYFGDDNLSSACEILAILLRKTKINIPKYALTAMLCGIKIDTADFNVKTTKETYKSAYYLIKLGADNKEAQYLLKQPLKNYIDRQDLITQTEIYYNKIAISIGYPHEIYGKEDLAKVSNALLKVENIEMSFTIGRIKKDEVGISARSLGNISVQAIMEKLGGGGDIHDAAAVIKKLSILEAKESLLKAIEELEVR